MSRQKSQTRSRTDWRAWKLELLALFGSALSFAAMVVLLAVFNGRPIFEWKRVTLNAIISTLSVSMKASFTFAIAELIGQWKWITFSRDAHPLFEFERIDMASRGPLGGIRVLFKKNSSGPLRLGSALIVLTIALDPFSQQLLQLQPGTEFSGPGTPDWATQPVALESNASGTPSTTRATWCDAGDMNEVNMTESRQPDETVITVGANLAISMQAAVLDGVSRSEQMVKQQSRVQCPTGICTWSPFQTLGVCHRCSDLSPSLEKHPNFGSIYEGLMFGDGSGLTWDEIKNTATSATAFVLPNGHFLVKRDEEQLIDFISPSGFLMSPFGTGNPNKTNSMQDMDTLIWSMSFIRPAESALMSGGEDVWPDVDMSAQECAIYYCVKEIDIKVDGNIVQENATEIPDAKRDPNSWSPDFPIGEYAPENVPPNSELASLEFDELYSYFSRSDLVLHFPDEPSRPSYSIMAPAVWSLNYFIQQLFSTNITGGANMAALISDLLPNSSSAGYNGAIDGFGAEPPSLDGIWPSNPDLPATFSVLATSITNGIRASVDDDLYGTVVLGHTGIPTQYYKTDWGWIVLHGMMLIGGALFFYVTVWNQASSLREIPTWKNSSLAVLSQGPGAEAVLNDTDLVAEMERRARREQVKIARDHGSTGFQMKR